MMLVPFTFSPGCMQPLGADVPSARARVVEVRRLWKRAGVLVVDSDKRLLTHYHQRLSSEHLPGWLRRLWHELLMELGNRVLIVPEWRGPSECQPSDPEDILPANSLVIHLNESGAWGFGEQDASRMIGECLEVCRLDCLPDTRFARAVDESGGTFKKKTPTSEVLQRFNLACEIPKSVVIIDQYLGKEEVVKPGKSGGGRFVQYLASIRVSASQRLESLTVISAKDVARSMSNKTIIGGKDIVGAWQSVRSAIPAEAIAEFRLCLVKSDRFGSVAHDRFARFGDFAVQVGAGFGIFEGKGLSKQTTISPADVERVKELEGTLRWEKSFEEVLL